MTVKTGIKWIAIGFLFILLNLNLTISGAKVDVLPNFVGWFLFFLAYDRLGEYKEGKAYLKWGALALTVLTAAQWALAIAAPDSKGIVNIIETIVSFGQLIYTFVLLGLVAMIARDKQSPRGERIDLLRYIILIAQLVLILLAVILIQSQKEIIALPALGAGIVLLVCSVMVAYTLFKLANEIDE